MANNRSLMDFLGQQDDEGGSGFTLGGQNAGGVSGQDNVSATPQAISGRYGNFTGYEAQMPDGQPSTSIQQQYQGLQKSINPSNQAQGPGAYANTPGDPWHNIPGGGGGEGDDDISGIPSSFKEFSDWLRNNDYKFDGLLGEIQSGKTPGELMDRWRSSAGQAPNAFGDREVIDMSMFMRSPGLQSIYNNIFSPGGIGTDQRSMTTGKPRQAMNAYATMG